MNNLQIFNNAEFGSVRTVLVNKEPLFCLADVCRALDLEQASRVKTRLKQDGVTTSKVIDSLGRAQRATFINEPNLYKIIFQSRKPNAEKFTDWVTTEVLPAIRKRGVYAMDELISNPDLLIAIATQLKEEKTKNTELQQKIEADKPKTIFADAVATSTTSILVGDLAKLICQNGYTIGQKRLFEWLRKNGYLIKSGCSYNMPKQQYVEQGLFEVKESTWQNPDGSIRVNKTTKVTGKGQIYFVNKFLNERGDEE